MRRTGGLAREDRLRRQADFSRVYRTGVRAGGRLILVVAARPGNPGRGRLGVSVGRRYDRSAVRRNRAKRVLRAAWRLLGSDRPAYDVILIPRAPVHELRAPAVRDELVTLIARAERKLRS
ncbi:MAG: ribonuclease P protein component [Planctomycetota bacterium]|nr:MAG: ribonuclease P protein component [Planctomycetota bacterium]